MQWLILFLLLFVSCEKETAIESARPVKVLKVTDSSVSSNQIIFPGTLRALKRADLSFRVDGIVLMRDINVGFNAKKNQILMQLDPRDYKVAVKKAKGKVESTQAQLDFADRDYVRMQKIFERDPGAISESLLDRKKETFNQLKAELTIATSDLEKALDDLSYTFLKAPFDGIVAAIYVENHEQVRAKQSVLRFIDTADREMEINVPEKYINYFLEGKEKLKFEVKLDAFPDNTFKAAIEEIGTEASSTTQTYPVTLSLEVPLEMSLLAGMSGRALLSLSKENATPVFQLPAAALFTDNGNTAYVWVVDPKTETVQKKKVVVQSSQDDKVLIQEGISPGDLIVIAGTSFLREGQKIKPIEGL